MFNRRAPYLALFLLSSAACSGVSSIDSCPPGTTEVSGICTAGCMSNADCLPTEVCAASGACVPGPRADTGVMTTADTGADGGPSGTDAQPDAGMNDAQPMGDAETLDGTPVGADGSDASVTDTLPVDTGPPADSGVPEATLSDVNVTFGRQVIGTRESMTIDVTNNSTVMVTVEFGAITGPGAAAFSVLPATGTRMTLSPSQSQTIELFHAAMTPAGTINAIYAIDLCDVGCSAQVALQANPVLDAIECLPSLVDFGLVNPGACIEMPLSCTNTSSYEAAIEAWALSTNTSPDFTIEPSPTANVTLLPAQAQTVDVQYCPNMGGGVDTGIAAITVDHPDPTRVQRFVDLTGRAGGQDIECAPTDVNFGLVGIGVPVQRIVACRNRGNIPLRIDGVTLTGGQATEFSTEVRRNMTPSPLPQTLGSNETILIFVSHTASNNGMRGTTLTISSNDRDTPTIQVAVASDAIDTSGCSLTITPATLPFGNVRISQTAEQDIIIENGGTGPCAATIVGIQSQLTLQPATPFEILSAATTGSIPAGGQMRVKVGFTPDSPMSWGDQLILQVSNPAMPFFGVDLSGSGYEGDIFVDPPFIDFGTVPVGCVEPALRFIRIRNDNPQRVVVSGVGIVASTSGAYVTSSTTGVPLEPGEERFLPVGFQPPMTGGHGARLRIDFSSGEMFFVQLWGDGANNGTNVLSFDPIDEELVDVLFVIDDSASMAEEQAKLASFAQNIVAFGDAARINYHFGVITTGGSGVIAGMPPIIERGTGSRYSAIGPNLLVGTTGPAAEQGLLAARTAVTDPNLLNGANAGFLRPGADLVIVAFSDADDDSPGPIADYIDPMRVTQTGDQRSVSIIAVTGEVGGCTIDGTNAAPAQRWSEAVDRTSGFQFSICNPDYEELSVEIGKALFGDTRNAFQLGSPPSPSLEVRVDGALIPALTGTVANYYTHYEAGVIAFPPNATPVATSRIELRYDAYCVLPTCNNTMLDPGEQCDDGNGNNNDMCTDECYNAFCGDLEIYTGVEQCDDGNTFPGDGCDHLCVIEGCGNGIFEPPAEECDDGPQNSDTTAGACRTNCRDPFCGDGVNDGGAEACDDGNGSNNDACLTTCVNARCGDGNLQFGVEACDDGNGIDTDACNNRCEWNVPAFTVSSQPRPLIPADGQQDLVWTNGNPDDGVAIVSIGFPFSFLGAPVNDVFVSSNGWLSFLNTTDSDLTNRRMPNNAPPNALIAWWWDDLNFTQTAVPAMTTAATRIDGATPNRVRTIVFENVPAFGAAADHYLLTAEVRLREGSNVIEVHYGRIQIVGMTPPNDFSASAGWEDAAGLNGQNVLGCGATCGASVWPTNTIFTYRP